MPRPYLVDRPHHMLVTIPQSLYARLALYLYSPLEGRVPQGAYQSFFVARIEEHLAKIEKGKQ